MPGHIAVNSFHSSAFVPTTTDTSFDKPPRTASIGISSRK
jgi:hypothetical protein